MRLTADVHINRNRDDVFALWADLERSTEYSAATIERRKLTDGPTGSGTRYHAVDRWPGRVVEFIVEIDAYEPPALMAASWSNGMAGGWEARFRVADGGTDLAFTTLIEPSGLMRLLTPVMRPWATRQLRQFMADFRAWAEAQPATVGASLPNAAMPSRVGQ